VKGRLMEAEVKKPVFQLLFSIFGHGWVVVMAYEEYGICLGLLE
jgi:hypothetical protein